MTAGAGDTTPASTPGAGGTPGRTRAGGQRMSGGQARGQPPARPRAARHENALLRGGLTSIALVSAATVGLAAAAGLIALLISLLYA